MNTPDSGVLPNAARAGRAVGALFFFAFGGAWICLWALNALVSPWPVVVAVVVVSLALLALAYKVYRANAAAMRAVADTSQAKRRSRLFNIVNAGQWVLIFVVASVLANTGHADWIVAAVIFIIGLHFLPLARVFAYPSHYLTGSALMILALAYPMLAPSGSQSPVGCLGAGLVLWASALWAVAARPCPRPTDTAAAERN
jgi:uncharacterized membrane protein